MNRTLTTAATTAILAVTLAACSSGSSTSNTDSGNKGSSASGAAVASKPLTASTAFTKLAGTVASAKLSGTVTADNDPNHLLGRPNQYTSKVTFTDSRINASDVSGSAQGDVNRGGAIEAFANAADATARAKYIQAVTKTMPALAEYDYVHGAILVRVSHYLTPAQAQQYKTAADGMN